MAAGVGVVQATAAAEGHGLKLRGKAALLNGQPSEGPESMQQCLK